ncbi:MAG: sugar lactone lactonase YvrE, partial [Parvicellaceae bacterium]
MKKLVLLYCLLIAFGINAQTLVTISQLPDTLQPKIVETNTRKAPEVVSLSLSKTKPKVTPFAPNVAQGKSNFATYTSDDGLAMDAVNYGKTTVCDSEGNIWFATQGGGVSKYDGNSFITYTTDQGLANNVVLSIAADKIGNLWFGTSGGGVSKYDGNSFITYTTEQGLANNYVFSIAAD